MGATYVSTKVVWQPAHRGASTTVLEPAHGERLHAMHPEAGATGLTMCGVGATRVEGSWSAVTQFERCSPCAEAIDPYAIDLRTVRAEPGD